MQIVTTTQAQIDTAIRFHIRAAIAHEEVRSAYGPAHAERETEKAQAALGSLTLEIPAIDKIADEIQWASDAGMHHTASLAHREMASALAMLP